MFLGVLRVLKVLGVLGVLRELGSLGDGLVEGVAYAFLVGHLGFGIYLADAGDLIVLFLQVDESHALCSAAHNPERADLEPDGDTGLVDDDKVVVVVHILDCN